MVNSSLISDRWVKYGRGVTTQFSVSMSATKREKPERDTCCQKTPTTVPKVFIKTWTKHDWKNSNGRMQIRGHQRVRNISYSNQKNSLYGSNIWLKISPNLRLISHWISNKHKNQNSINWWTQFNPSSLISSSSAAMKQLQPKKFTLCVKYLAENLPKPQFNIQQNFKQTQEPIFDQLVIHFNPSSLISSSSTAIKQPKFDQNEIKTCFKINRICGWKKLLSFNRWIHPELAGKRTKTNKFWLIRWQISSKNG